MSAKIFSVEFDPPPEGLVVETISKAGLVQPLKRSGGVWFIPSGEMYVYYAPVAWAYLENED